MTLRGRCDDTNTEIIVVKQGWGESGKDGGIGREQDRGRRRKGRRELMTESWGNGYSKELSCREIKMHVEANRDGDNISLMKRARMDTGLRRERDRGGRWREMEGGREIHIMWQRHDDSDTELMKTKGVGGCLRRGGKEVKREKWIERNRTDSSLLLSSPLFHRRH